MARSRWIKLPSTLSKRLRKAGQSAIRLGEAYVQAATDELAEQARRRVTDLAPFTVNKQDSPAGRSSPNNTSTKVTSNVRGLRGQVTVRAFFGSARRTNVRRAFQRAGRANELRRDGLILRRPPGRMNFKDNPRLERWARAKGQFFRHTVFIDGRPLAATVLTPAFRMAQSRNANLFETTFKNFL